MHDSTACAQPDRPASQAVAAAPTVPIGCLRALPLALVLSIGGWSALAALAYTAYTALT